jgi:peptidoglycan-N-acetylglucosamine deacetylase
MVMEAFNQIVPVVAASPWGPRIKRLVPRALAIRRLHASDRPTVLLTFDDGPDPEITPAVLDRLAAYDAKAVFFLVGRRVRRASDLVRRIRAGGHAIGNHSHLHRAAYVLPDLPQPRFLAYYRDCARCQRCIEDAAGVRPTLFRPPGGRLTPATLLVPRMLGLRSVIWSVQVQDWAFRQLEEAREGAAELLERIVPGDIVLLHDINPHVITLLDVLLPALRSRGYDLAGGVDLL